MQVQTDAIGLTTLILVILPWVACGGVLLLRKKPVQAEEAKRAPAATWGIVLQSLSFALVWLLPRSVWWPFRASLAGELAVAVVAVVLAYGSSWLCVRAVQTLGKQWTYQARVIKGHELVTQGPYSLVRNPIYLGMFGAILATGLAFSRWWNFLGAVILFLVGNRIRIQAEEKLLRETFGRSSMSTPAAFRPSFRACFNLLCGPQAFCLTSVSCSSAGDIGTYQCRAS